MAVKKIPKKQITETITIRPTAKYKGIANKLKSIADKDNRSLNSFLLMNLDKIVKANVQ